MINEILYPFSFIQIVPKVPKKTQLMPKNDANSLTIFLSGYKEQIVVSGLAPGMYFVRIGDKVGKFVKI